jgi:hypothetical protein
VSCSAAASPWDKRGWNFGGCPLLTIVRQGKVIICKVTAEFAELAELARKQFSGWLRMGWTARRVEEGFGVLER